MYALLEVVEQSNKAQPIGKYIGEQMNIYSPFLTRLLKAAEEAIKEDSSLHLDIVKELTLDHMEVAKQHIKNPDILDGLLSQLEKDCRRLRSFLQAAEVRLDASNLSTHLLSLCLDH